MRTRILTTTVIVILLVIGMTGVRHIDHLEDGIKLKQIEIQDNSAKLKLLDKKYIELNKQLDKSGTDKQKLEEQLKQLQNEREELQKALQAKKEQKERDIAVKTQRAVTGTAVASAATGSCADWIAAAGIPNTPAVNALIGGESGCRPNAVNPSSGACGIPQALPCSKLPCSLSDPVCQLKWMDSYVAVRYGSWDNAYATWLSRSPHWY